MRFTALEVRLQRFGFDRYLMALALTILLAALLPARGSFAEGAPIYPGSKILQKAHTQIAVRDTACILRASLVQFP